MFTLNNQILGLESPLAALFLWGMLGPLFTFISISTFLDLIQDQFRQKVR
jgi:hypothetical protein